jgi:hypothetical protein
MLPLSAKNAIAASLLLAVLSWSHGASAAPPPSKAECNAALQAALVTNLSFGDFEGSIAGAITIDTAGNRTTTGPVLAGGVVSAAAYDVWTNLAGCEKRNVTTTLPGSITLTGPASMTANAFTRNPPNKFKLTVLGAPTRVTVGATLNTAAGQAGGGYTVPFTVQFNH